MFNSLSLREKQVEEPPQWDGQASKRAEEPKNKKKGHRRITESLGNGTEMTQKKLKNLKTEKKGEE
jgi:hypothetical protein